MWIRRSHISSASARRSAGEPAPARRCRPLQAAQRRRHIRASHRTVLGAIQQRYKAAREHGRVSEGGIAAVREAGFTEAELVEIVAYISLSSPGRGRRLPPRTRCWRRPRGRGRCRGRVRAGPRPGSVQAAGCPQAGCGGPRTTRAGRLSAGRFGTCGQVTRAIAAPMLGSSRVSVRMACGDRSPRSSWVACAASRWMKAAWAALLAPGGHGGGVRDHHGAADERGERLEPGCLRQHRLQREAALERPQAQQHRPVGVWQQVDAPPDGGLERSVRGRVRRDQSQTRLFPAGLASGRDLGVVSERVNPALEAAPLADHQFGITKRVREERDSLV